MKTSFLLLLAAGLGLVPLNVLSLQAFLGAYTSLGVLALAVYDYGRSAPRNPRARRNPAPRRAEPAVESGQPAGSWTYQTLSA